ncbi:MAG: helix-turn-helix transcriptional regulator [Anaerovoracaceae bacterium]
MDEMKGRVIKTQAIKNAPEMREHQQGANQIHQFKSNTNRARNQEVIFTENSLCPACKRGHLAYRRQIMTVHPITYIIRNACNRCGAECVSYKEDNTKTLDVRAIIAARTRRKMSREKLADVAKVHVYYVRNLENKKDIINFDVVSRVAAALGLNLKNLIKTVGVAQCK